MTGWRHLITATVRLAHRHGTSLRRRPADGRLLFEPVGETTNGKLLGSAALQTGREARRRARPADYIRGILTGTWALSAEICQACGGPGDPVILGSGGRGTRCGDCRESGDQALPRPAWRREYETGHEVPGLLEDLVGTEDLADLMEARHTPTTHSGWPVRRAQGDPDDWWTLSPIGAAGWNHLLRAGFALLLPLECPGVAPPWRLSRVKERLGRLRVSHCHHTPFYEGIATILSDLSATTCIHCGRPGRLRRPGWMHPTCDQCWALERRNGDLRDQSSFNDLLTEISLRVR